MYIVLLEYICPIEEIDRHLAEHMTFLEKYFSAGYFIASGRQIPRKGGVIICRATNTDELDAILHEDPFWKRGLVSHKIIEFNPTRTRLENFVSL